MSYIPRQFHQRVCFIRAERGFNETAGSSALLGDVLSSVCVCVCDERSLTRVRKLRILQCDDSRSVVVSLSETQ